MKRRFVHLFGTLLLNLLVIVMPMTAVRYWLVFALLWILPGLSWGTLIPHGLFSRSEQLMVSLGLNYVIVPAITLGAVYWPGPLSWRWLLLALVVTTSVPLAYGLLSQRKHPSSTISERSDPLTDTDSRPVMTNQSNQTQRFWSSQNRRPWVWFAVVMLIAGSLRLIYLGYSEFQGDEAAVMTRSAKVILGDNEALFEHKKGPAELATVIATWAMTGVTSEWMARLPFAWASLLGVAAVYLIGYRLGSPRIALFAALFSAIEGYLVGFGRIVQYQSIVIATSALAILVLLVYRKRGAGPLPVLAAALLAGGALAHYDAVLALPAAILLIGHRLWQDRSRMVHHLILLALAGILGIALLALFYVPFLRSSQVGITSSYVAARLGGGQGLFNHLPSTFERTALYDAVYLLALMATGLVTSALVTWRKWARGGAIAVFLLLTAASTTILRPEWWVIDNRNWAFIPVAIWLVSTLFLPGLSIRYRALWLWFAVPMMFYLFLVALPLTHVYTFVPAWALLAGLGSDKLARRLGAIPRLPSVALGTVPLLLFALSAYYAWMVFVSHTPEYVRTYPEHRNPIFWTPFTELPEEGLFGFPHQAGWKAIGHLMEQGLLSGSYDSNEEGEITDYYTRQAERLDCASPDLYMIASDVQDEVAVRSDQISADYDPTAIITVNGYPTITVFERGFSGTAIAYSTEQYATLFDQSQTPERLISGVSHSVDLSTVDYVPREAQIGDFARLLGYQLNEEHAVPGGYLELTLFWQALGPAPIDYQVFTHLHDGTMMRGQLDGRPGCGNAPTSSWRADQIITDPYRIPVKTEAPTGHVPLTVGMYDLVTLQRLPVYASDGRPDGDNIYLTDVLLRSEVLETSD